MEKIRILLADDNPVVREELSALLNLEEDFEVVGVAADGVEAVEKAEELSPQLVLMDVKMPRMDGLVATRELKKRYPNMHIVLLSIYDNQEYIKEGIDSGASAYIVKGIPFNELIQVIRDAQQGKFD